MPRVKEKTEQSGKKAVGKAPETKKRPPMKEKKTMAAKPKKDKGKIRVISLGGLQEIGKNLTVIEYENDMIVVDCGLAFPEEDMLGVDLVVAIGQKAAKIADGVELSGGEVLYFATKEEAMDTLREQLQPGTTMVVKASHSMHFGELVKQLQERYD